jgi:hypothetical protein
MKDTMNTVLWIIQGILALKLLTAVYTHAIRLPKSELGRSVDKMGSAARPALIASSVLMLLGVLGMWVPTVSEVPSWMVPAAASGLAALQLLSIAFHLRCREDPKVFVAVVLLTLAVLVAVGRWALSPL